MVMAVKRYHSVTSANYYTDTYLNIQNRIIYANFKKGQSEFKLDPKYCFGFYFKVVLIHKFHISFLTLENVQKRFT